MISKHLVNVFLIISLFVELAVCYCREGGRWCLTNGQCCSHSCSWTFKCKPKKVECVPQDSMCSNDKDCCSMNCINKADGQSVCGEAGMTSPEDFDAMKELKEKENINENKYGPQEQEENTIGYENGLKVGAGDENSESDLEENVEHLQPVTASEAEINNPLPLPENPFIKTMKPIPPHPYNSLNATKPKSSLNNSINIDVSSFENFLNTLHNISVSESLEE